MSRPGVTQVRADHEFAERPEHDPAIVRECETTGETQTGSHRCGDSLMILKVAPPSRLRCSLPVESKANKPLPVEVARAVRMMLSGSWSSQVLPSSREIARPGDGRQATQSVPSARKKGKAGVSRLFLATGGRASSVQLLP